MPSASATVLFPLDSWATVSLSTHSPRIKARYLLFHFPERSHTAEASIRSASPHFSAIFPTPPPILPILPFPQTYLSSRTRGLRNLLESSSWLLCWLLCWLLRRRHRRGTVNTSLAFSALGRGRADFNYTKKWGYQPE